MADLDPSSSVIHGEHAPIRAYPANVTFNDLIRSNKRKSAVLMVLMCALLMSLGAALTAAIVVYNGGGDLPSLIPSVIAGAVAAGIVAIIGALWSFYSGSSAILAISGAKEIPREGDPQLHNVVEELAIA